MRVLNDFYLYLLVRSCALRRVDELRMILKVPKPLRTLRDRLEGGALNERL